MEVRKKNKGYSRFIRPIIIAIDLSIINGNALIFLKEKSMITYLLLISFLWLLIAFYVRFYIVHRYTKVVTILSLLLKQILLFTLVLFTALRIYDDIEIASIDVIKYIILVFTSVGLVKYAKHYLLKVYRSEFGRNYRNTVIFGKNKSTAALKSFFEKNPEFGYNLKKVYNLKDDTFNFTESFNYIAEESIDEIYCSTSELSNNQIKQIVDFADNNLKKVKFIPDHRGIFSKKMYYEYYGYIPVLSLRNISLEVPINKIFKRIFDIIFSSLVIIFVLSWLGPLIALLIKLESKGPVIFSQKRNGLNNNEFLCYKFRSMVPNDEANHKQATRNDMRITKVGQFIRKTSIDELPQFFNVFLGDMSVIGPRPHMVNHNERYAKKVNKFMVRNFVKPGVTGLAQIKGYRGEIETDFDIINRVKYDVFYIENWSLLLDFKIVFQTVVNMVKGEEKAY